MESAHGGERHPLVELDRFERQPARLEQRAGASAVEAAGVHDRRSPGSSRSTNERSITPSRTSIAKRQRLYLIPPRLPPMVSTNSVVGTNPTHTIRARPDAHVCPRSQWKSRAAGRATTASDAEGSW